ncbi:MAG: ice-binding family protein [Trueperaceae bacterium]|nr:ice-binding family protein [Trueperaceae bacterium]
MKSFDRYTRRILGSMVIVLTVFLAACSTFTSDDTTAPVVTSLTPVAGATGVATNTRVVLAFDELMNPATLSSSDFTLAGGGSSSVAGDLAYDEDTDSLVFTPSSVLDASTEYTATLTPGIEDVAGNTLADDVEWSFTTADAVPSIQPVDLGTAADFVILAKTAVTTTGATSVVGDIGISPAAQSSITGFSETLDASGTFATSSLVTGRIYAADMAVPTPAKMTTAISDMDTAYTDAAGRTSPDFTELGAGDISGLTLVPGLYKWGTGVMVSTDVTLSGTSDDVWIFQVAQDLTVANGAQMNLSGGAQPENVFWQIAGQATFGTGSDVQGIVLSKTQIVLQSGAVFSGRALAQTAVTMDANTVTQPTD